MRGGIVERAYSANESIFMRGDHFDYWTGVVSGLGRADYARDVVAAPAGPEIKLRTYRLALTTDPSYATYFEGKVTAAKVTLMNRVNQVYEQDFAAHMVLIDATDRDIRFASPRA